MSQSRKNKAPRDNGSGAASWFTANVKRQRKRNKAAKESRKKNRGK